MYHPNLFGLIISQMLFLETHSYMLSSEYLLHECQGLLDLCACIFRLSPNRNCFVAWDKWPDQLHATASLLLSGESNLYCHLDRQGYLTIAKLNSLLACSEKFVSKFDEFWYKCTRVSNKMILILAQFSFFWLLASHSAILETHSKCCNLSSF